MEEIERAAAALRNGELVVFPTETVYGVAASATRPDAVARLRRLKNVQDSRPFTVHISDQSEAGRFVARSTPVMRRLSRKAWPGPLTLILNQGSPSEAPLAHQHEIDQLDGVFIDGTVALRCPAHSVAVDFLRAAAVPVVASGASRGAGPAATGAELAARELADAVDRVLDAGETRLKKASTIVEVQEHDWRIVREGAYDERTIRRLAHSMILFVCTGNSCRSPLAEYMLRDLMRSKLNMSAQELDAAGYRVASAGTHAFGGGPASEGTRSELARRGIDAAGHRSQPLTIELIQRAERIFAMTAEHRQAVVNLVPSAADRTALLDPAGPVSDPIGGGPEDYARCAAQIERALELRLQEFLDEDRRW